MAKTVGEHAVGQQVVQETDDWPFSACGHGFCQTWQPWGNTYISGTGKSGLRSPARRAERLSSRAGSATRRRWP